MNIEKEILSATKESKAGRKEDRDDYLSRMVKAMHGLDDDAWEDLSVEAQQWFNDAAKALNNKKQLPDFPDGKSSDSDDKIGKRSVGKKGKKDNKKSNKDDEIEGLSDLEKGMEVILYGKKDKILAEGEVIKVGKKAITILEDPDDEESVSVSRITGIEFLDNNTEGKDEGDEPSEEIDVDDIEEGQSIKFTYDDDDEVEGEVEKVKSKAIFIDGEKYKKDKIEDVTVISADNEGGGGDTIDISEVEVGMTVSIEMKNEDIIEGEVHSLFERKEELKAIFIGDDKERCGVSKIVSVKLLEGASKEEGEEEGGEEEGTNSNILEVQNIICKFPKMKLEKIVAKVQKSKLDIEDEDTIEEIYNGVHVILSMLKEHGKI